MLLLTKGSAIFTSSPWFSASAKRLFTMSAQVILLKGCTKTIVDTIIVPESSSLCSPFSSSLSPFSNRFEFISTVIRSAHKDGGNRRA